MTTPTLGRLKAVDLRTNLWRHEDGRNPVKGYGVLVATTWCWYDLWVEVVRQHCKTNAGGYR